MSLLPSVLAYGALCGTALFLGTVVSSRWWTPSPRARSYIQHAAAGLVFAAVGVEVLPDMLHRAMPLAAAVGFCLGVALVLGTEVLSERLSGGAGTGESGSESQAGLIAVIATDIFIDGLLIGVAAVTGGEGGSQALLVTLALAAEMLSLGLSLGCTLVAEGGFPKAKAALAGGILGVAPFTGAVLGFVVGTRVDGPWTEGILAFAAAALLYLAVEELLKDAHETKDTPVGNLLFFAAFLAVMLIDMAS